MARMPALCSQHPAEFCSVLLTSYNKNISKVLWFELFVLFDNIFVCVKNHFGLHW
jgi:hypothetical protein